MRWLYAGLRRLVLGAVLAAIFSASVLAAALVHLNLRAVRRIVEGRVNAALSSVPGDHTRISGLTRLTMSGARVGVLDAAVPGAGKVHAEDVRVDLPLVETLWRALRHRDVLSVRLHSVSIALLDIELRPGATVERQGPPGQELRLEVNRFDISHAWVRGQLETGPYLDVDCDRTSGSFGLDPTRVFGTFTSALTARGLVAVPLSLDIDGSASVPQGARASEVAARAARVHLVARTGEARLDAVATLDGDRLEAELSVPSTSPDAVRVFFPSWPLVSPVSLRALASGTLTEPSFEADAVVGSDHFAITGGAHLDRHPRAYAKIVGHSIDPSAVLEVLPKMRVAIDADLDVDQEGLRIAARAHDRRATLLAHVTLLHGFLNADAVVDAGQTAFGGIVIDEAHVDAEMRGRLQDLRGRLSAHLIGTRRGALGLADLRVMAEGTSDSLDVALAGKGGSLDVLALQATVEPRLPLRITGLSARFERAQQSIDLAAPEIVASEQALDAAHFQVGGLGSPVEGELHLAHGRIRAKLVCPNIDLAPLSAFVSSASGRLAGSGPIDVDLDSGLDKTKAAAHVRLARARIGSWPEVDAAIDLVLDGARAEGRIEVENIYLGAAALEAQIDAGRNITGVRSLANAQGSVILTTDRFPIERVCSVFDCPSKLQQSITSITGTMGARLEITRGPDMRADGQTRTESAEDTKLALSIDVQDADGRLAYVNAWSRTNLARAITLWRLPLDAPLEARFGLESRPFEKLPTFLQPLPLSGQLAIHGYAEGTISQPFFVVDVRGKDLRAPGASRETTPLELGWVTTYDLEDAASDVDIRMGETQVVRASLQVNASLQQLLGAPGDHPWSGGLYAEIDRFPLSLVPALAEREATGALSGKVSVSGIHEKPVVAGQLSIDDLRFGSETIGPVALSLEASEQSCLVSLEAGSPSTPRGGRAVLRAQAGCRWKNATIPTVVSDVPMELALDATQFPVVAVQPLVAEVFGRLRGNLDAHLRASGRPDQGIGRWAVRGEAHLRDTTLLPLVLGREINRLDVRATADGSGTVRISQYSGEMGAGAFTGQGTLLLRDNTVDQVHAELHVAKRRAIPVTIEGVSYGTVWGDVIGDARVADGQLLMTLKAPTLRLELPPQRTGNLETLDQNQAVVVLQPLSATPPSTAVGGGPGQARPHVPRVVASVQLGDNVGVSRDDLKIELTTLPAPQNPKVSLDGEITVNGSIRILGGRVPVAGRVFRVERGMVQFSGSDPADPALDVDAVYEGPDTSITIKVHVGGTAKDAKLTLQSTPAKSQSEILAILAFGEAAPATVGPGGLVGPQQGGTSTIAGAAGSAAAGVGSAIVTTGLNQILSQSIIPIRTSVSTGTTATASASASVDVTERVRIEYIRSFGTPTQVGQQQDDNQFAFAWRFKSRWMLRTIVGTRGTAALDLLWQRWY